MGEKHEMHVQMEQLPIFDLDPHDAWATRDWRKRCVEDEVALIGRLKKRMVHVGAGVMRVGQLVDDIEEPKIELQHAALFSVTAHMADVVRSFREGEITVEEADGKYRAVIVLEFAHATQR